MKISARNQLQGKISKIEAGPINAKITLTLDSPPTLVAVVTKEAVEELELSEGGQACAIIKASSVLLAACDDAKCGCKH
ncbi:TOBE domain-containing protein [Novipirellula artificiosorum]|uniref:Molybdenum-pterin-binding protein 2 n=1 Tax=Novipirellula artificiosorum TaxID=2528016 RepID=A0A5C6E0L9_9BACT|nr:molybdopterin-binding protein [Novipirellula artificiosorum]TWU42265.1 Molybdenum-pterin-binding protein 2 [Novipirellula artificiosorum]